MGSNSDGLGGVLLRETRGPHDESQGGDSVPITVLTVVAIDADDLLPLVKVDVGEGTVPALGADALDAALILVEVNIADHRVKLDARRNVVHAVVPILVIVEGDGVKDERSGLLIKAGGEEGTRVVVEDDLDGGQDAERVLLVPDLAHAHLLNVRQRLQHVLTGPLEIKVLHVISVRLEHWQLANAILDSLQGAIALIQDA